MAYREQLYSNPHGIANLSAAKFRSLISADVLGADLSSYNLSEYVFKHVRLSYCILTNADFSNTKFDDVKFINANVMMANFTGAQFRYVSFKNANLAFARLEGCDLSLGCDLTDAFLHGHIIRCYEGNHPMRGRPKPESETFLRNMGVAV